jgi:uncharacterized protein YndB with AHSA1/START domain
MTRKPKTIAIKLQRTIPASPSEVYDAWLDPENPGSPWHEVDMLILDPKVDGLFYRMHLDGEGEPLPHFGRFTTLERPRKVQHTWMSMHTRGLESVVTLTLEPKGEDTLLTLHHAGLPDDELGRVHEGGWAYYLDGLLESFDHGG